MTLNKHLSPLYFWMRVSWGCESGRCDFTKTCNNFWNSDWTSKWFRSWTARASSRFQKSTYLIMYTSIGNFEILTADWIWRRWVSRRISTVCWGCRAVTRCRRLLIVNCPITRVHSFDNDRSSHLKFEKKNVLLYHNNGPLPNNQIEIIYFILVIRPHFVSGHHQTCWLFKNLRNGWEQLHNGPVM